MNMQAIPNSPIPPHISTQGISEETDRLLRKWLKMQIFNFYWTMVFRLLMFILIAGSLIFSTLTLAPIVERQLSVLQNLQQSVQNISSFTDPLQNLTSPTTIQNNEVEKKR